MIRRLAREAVIFMLVSAALAGVCTAAYELFERHKVIGESAKAVEKYKARKAEEAKLNPTQEHPVWIYVDLAQEFDGYFVERPHPPPQIAKLVKDGVHCHPGSVTWSPDNIEWVCVLPKPKPANYHAGDFMLFDTERPPGQMGQYTDADIDKPSDQNPTTEPNMPLFVIKTYGEIGFESLLFSAFAFGAGLGLWLFYRLVKFAVQG